MAQIVVRREAYRFVVPEAARRVAADKNLSDRENSYHVVEHYDRWIIQVQDRRQGKIVGYLA